MEGAVLGCKRVVAPYFASYLDRCDLLNESGVYCALCEPRIYTQIRYVRCHLNHGVDVCCVDAVERCQFDSDLAYVGVARHCVEQNPKSGIEFFVVPRMPQCEMLPHLGG